MIPTSCLLNSNKSLPTRCSELLLCSTFTDSQNQQAWCVKVGQANKKLYSNLCDLPELISTITKASLHPHYPRCASITQFLSEKVFLLKNNYQKECSLAISYVSCIATDIKTRKVKEVPSHRTAAMVGGLIYFSSQRST